MNIKILQDLGLQAVTFDIGTVLIEEGKRNRNVFVLVSGKVMIKSGGHQIAIVEDAGTILGEISVLLAPDPVATVVTTEPSEFYVIEDFMTFVRENSEACVSMAQILACRLINMNNQLVFVKDNLVELQGKLRDYVPVFPENFQT